MANQFARSLRTNATPAERVLWQQLRLLKLEGRHFRRQVPIAGYVVDFACHKPKLIVELDGSQHAEQSAIVRDERRSREIAAQGYAVMRFWNNEVFESLEGVVDLIRNALGLPTAFEHEKGNPAPGTSAPRHDRLN